MTIYNYLEIVFFILLFLEIKGPYAEPRRLRFFWIETILVFAILAFRNYDVGADSILYTSYYSDPSTYEHEMPIGFDFFCKFLRTFTNNWRFFFFVTSLLAIFPFCYLVKRYATIVSLPFLTFMLCWKQLWLIETPIKQTTAIAFFFLGYILFCNYQKKKSLLLVIIAVALIIFSLLNHSSLIFIAPFFLLIHFIKLGKKLSILLVMSTVGLSSILILVIPALYDTLRMYTMAYSLFDNVGNYEMDVATGLESYNMKMFLMPSIYVSLLIAMCDEKEVNSIAAKSLVLGTVIFNLFASFPNIPRVILFFTIYGSSLCPMAILHRRTSKKTSIYFLALVLMMFAFFYIHLKLCINFKPTMDADYLPYSFWIGK